MNFISVSLISGQTNSNPIDISSRMCIILIVIMAAKRILCIGGAGQLGKHVTKTLLPYHITNIDFKESPTQATNILLKSSLSSVENNKQVINHFKNNPAEKYDAIVVTAGGWVGGSIKDDDYLTKCQQMLDMNLMPSLLGAHLATKILKEKGLVVFTGAAAVFKEPQPEMIAYSISKTGVHSLALNLTQAFIQQQAEQRVVTILPQVIDTESNRLAMPKSDFTKWAKPQQIAELIKGWVDGLNVPNNGSFALLKVKNQCVNAQFV